MDKGWSRQIAHDGGGVLRERDIYAEIHTRSRIYTQTHKRPKEWPIISQEDVFLLHLYLKRYIQWTQTSLSPKEAAGYLGKNHITPLRSPKETVLQKEKAEALILKTGFSLKEEK